MKSIEVAVLNPEVIPSAEKMMVCAARLTQRGHKIKSLDDFMALYNKSYTEDTVTTMTKLPHPTIQKFGAINVVIVGASRRFLAQITRHQNEVKFMSASLQYSDYSDDAAFAIPYEVMERGEEETYLTSCKLNMANYAEAVRYGLDNDAAGYMAPQGLRNVLIISATPYQWKHITLTVIQAFWSVRAAGAVSGFIMPTRARPTSAGNAGRRSTGPSLRFIAKTVSI